jgi:hypothetical protein
MRLTQPHISLRVLARQQVNAFQLHVLFNLHEITTGRIWSMFSVLPY